MDTYPLAAKTAREFSNIPGLPHAEIELAAQESLDNAARLFDPSKGDFQAYAARAMRNALRDLYEKQVRHHQHHLYILDQPATESSTQAEALIARIPEAAAKHSPEQAAIRESTRHLETAIAALSPRLRLVTEGIRDGKSYTEIGASLGIFKQAAHKLAHAAFVTLRDHLAAMGYHGIDTVGLLKSNCGVPPPDRNREGSAPRARVAWQTAYAKASDGQTECGASLLDAVTSLSPPASF